MTRSAFSGLLLIAKSLMFGLKMKWGCVEENLSYGVV